MSAGTVLVVDDEPAIHRFMAPALAANGYEACGRMTGCRPSPRSPIAGRTR